MKNRALKYQVLVEALQRDGWTRTVSPSLAPLVTMAGVRGLIVMEGRDLVVNALDPPASVTVAAPLAASQAMELASVDAFMYLYRL